MDVLFSINWKISFRKLDNMQPNNCLSKHLGMILNDSFILKLRKSKNSAAFELHRNGCKNTFRTTFHIFINNSNPKKRIAHKQRTEMLYENKNRLMRLSFPIFLKNVQKPKKISIVAKVRVIQPKMSAENENKVPVSENSPSFALAELSNDLGFMLNNQILSDVTINCNNQIFSAHKSIIVARCPTLAQAFQNTGLESVKINIHDLAPDVMMAMLYYIYTGKIEPLTVISACDLLLAGDIYNLQSLKNVCVNYLKDSLTVDNIVRIFTYAYMCDDILRFHVLKFMSCHFSAIENSDDWQNFRKEKPHLATDVLTGIVKFLEQR